MSKKRKSKGSKGKKKKSSSKLERETLKLQIKDRENKIEWRNAMVDILKKDTLVCQNEYEQLMKDKENIVKLLEEAIENQILRNGEIKAAIPEAEQKENDKENMESSKLLTLLQTISEEKTKDLNAARDLQEKINTIESHNAEKCSQEIIYLEEKLAKLDQDKNINKTELRERQTQALKVDLLKIFKEKVTAFQEDCSRKLNKHIAKIAEETRWWKDSGDILKTIKESLQMKNNEIYDKIEEENANLKQQKYKALSISMMVEKQKRLIVKLENRNVDLNENEKHVTELLKEQKLLVSLREIAKQDLKELNENLTQYTSLIRYNEYHIYNLEKDIVKENLLEDDMRKVLDKARILVTEEVKCPVIKLHNEIDKQINVKNLESIFNEATRHILESQYG